VRYLPSGTPLLLVALDAIIGRRCLYFMYQIRRNPRLGARSQ